MTGERGGTESLLGLQYVIFLIHFRVLILILILATTATTTDYRHYAYTTAAENDG